MVKIKKYLSHSANKSNEVHPLRDHLTGTALRMSGFCGADRHHALFKLTGLLHDLGKYRAAFQKYLVEGGRRGSVPHAVYGAGLARRNKQLEASFAIAGHHKGLPDRADWKNDTQEFQQNDNKDFCELVEIFRSDIGLLDDTLSCERIIFNDSYERELFTRYLYSSLTDADWLDTEAHFNPDVTSHRESRILEANVYIEKIDAAIASKSRDGEINELRNAALDEAVRNSAGPPGFYSLNLPTGMGKTLTSFMWAVRHAKANGLKRIIIVLPYINIIEQTAEALKSILGEHAVLEHHSSNNENGLDTGENDNEGGGSHDVRKLATENWDYPVIVTTTVQFFESLFSNRPSKCRKVHNISKSVVIFDEVQTLPKEMIAPTITMLKNGNYSAL
ncbi:MAG TPA: CRISPR-associated endonuclease Cas3'' [Spirochaetota bacterium]|nr:CRISPR-associated endonuclease Cas3'' [Spirochaetota bacterium]